MKKVHPGRDKFRNIGRNRRYLTAVCHLRTARIKLGAKVRHTDSITREEHSNVRKE